MNLNHKLLPGIISAAIAISGLGLVTPSFAGGHKHHGGGGHKHHGRGGHHPHPHPAQHHHHNNDLAIGLGVGALVGAIAVASAASDNGPQYYGPHHCRRVVVRRRCHTNQWGDYICRNVRFVQHRC